MGSNISLTIPQPERSNSTYAQSIPRFKNNFYMLFALSWMEHFVDVLSPFDEVFCQVQKRSSSTSSKKTLDNSEVETEAKNQTPTTPPNNGIRMSKDNLYMITALWMENLAHQITKPGKKDMNTSEETRKEVYKNVGAVLVSPDDVIWDADCSRDGVHAVARLLMKHHDKAKDCKMFMSRKPCSLCARLLVQAKVKRVSYLPLEPEYYCDRSPQTKPEAKEIEDSNEMHKNEVDNLFTASAIAQTRFGLQDIKPVAEKKKNETPDELKKEVEVLKNQFIEKFRFQLGWEDKIEEELPWPGFDNIKGRFIASFDDAIDWMARVQVQVKAKEESSGRGWNYNFKLSEDSKQSDSEDSKQNDSEDSKQSDSEDSKQSNSDFDPVTNKDHIEQARHFMAMARFLAERTDDQKTGVGAVIVSYPEMEIVALGWNGYPFKAQPGEFPIASDEDEDAPDKKYPYVIHAEQNALLMRNTKNIKDSILFVTKSPCHECAPLIAKQGIKTVVKDDDKKLSDNKEPKGLDYTVFLNMVNEGKFVCYQTEKCETDSKGNEPTEQAT